MRDYGKDLYDAFFVFDADNLLEKNYITEMNKTYSDGYQIVTSYRNSKNYGDNWISAGYALWFLRESQYLNKARMLLGTSCAVSGTGFMFSREILEKVGGWKFYFLTEDIEFTVHNVVEGVKIGYCKDAVIYDEQPTKFSQSWKQRMRWSRGYLRFSENTETADKGVFKGSFACFDMSMVIMPAIVLSILSIIINISAAVAELL
jgi:cellulose synthase/poly-beta-1,6-N-acetylglucosamine synthase-like glycosyltransferase